MAQPNEGWVPERQTFHQCVFWECPKVQTWRITMDRENFDRRQFGKVSLNAYRSR